MFCSLSGRPWSRHALGNLAERRNHPPWLRHSDSPSGDGARGNVPPEGYPRRPRLPSGPGGSRRLARAKSGGSGTAGSGADFEQKKPLAPERVQAYLMAAFTLICGLNLSWRIRNEA